jgi:archaellum biogenesis ATPase FlaH
MKRRDENTQELYSQEVQQVLISFMISDPSAFALSQNIIKDEYFDGRLRPAVREILNYSNEYKTLPTPEQITAMTGVNVEYFSNVQPQHSDWYLKTIEGFCRHRAIENVILEGTDLLNEGAGAEVERRIREAMTISLMKDLGTNYFVDPKTRLERLRDRSNFCTTGWKTLDARLYGGFTRGALNVFAGGSGSGKSLFLQNIARNWALLGLNVIYFSLELSEDLVSMRIDSMSSGFTTKEILTRINEVHIAVTKSGRGAGDLIIKKMPEAGTTANDLRAYLKEYEIQTGKRPDAIIVDYLDLMSANSGKINPGDLFVKDKYTSEEMRALAGETNTLCVTASQLNRQSVEAGLEMDHSHIAGGISKINTADNVFGIFATPAMKEQGKYQLLFLKTRSSSAVGQKMDLKYDPSSLVISDCDDDSEMVAPNTSSAIRDQLKKGSPSSSTFTPVSVEEGESLRTKMMDMMTKNRR